MEVIILFFTATVLIHERRFKDGRCENFVVSYLILWFLSVKPWQQRSVFVPGNPTDSELLPGSRTHWCHRVCSLLEKRAAQARCPNYRWEDRKILLLPFFSGCTIFLLYLFRDVLNKILTSIHLILIFHSVLNTLLFNMSVSSQTSEFLSLDFFFLTLWAKIKGSTSNHIWWRKGPFSQNGNTLRGFFF